MRKTTLFAAIAASTMMLSSPAVAGGWGDWDRGSWSWNKGGKDKHHKHYCGCGHKTCGDSSTSGGSSGGSTGGSSSGGTPVPEPGMLGMLGLGLMGVGFARRRMRK